MKFKARKNPVYWWPVKVEVPNPAPESAGEMVAMTFRAQFRAMSRDETNKLADEIAALDPKAREQRQFDDMLTVCVGWDGDVVDDDEQPIPFGREQLRGLMQWPWFRTGLYRAYYESLSGEAARRGN